MKLKILIDHPADQGTRFLCPNCTASKSRVIGNQPEYFCTYITGPGDSDTHINKEVTTCSGYSAKDVTRQMQQSRAYKSMKDEALYMFNDGLRYRFVTRAQAKAEKLLNTWE
jgi:hypothetical protein